MYNFPSNPTGGTLNKKQRDELLEFAKKHDLWIISDEVYDRIVFEAEHVSFMGTGYEKTLLVNSFSKTFAMTGWRIGYYFYQFRSDGANNKNAILYHCMF